MMVCRGNMKRALNHGTEPGKRNLHTDVTRDRSQDPPAVSYSIAQLIGENHTLVTITQNGNKPSPEQRKILGSLHWILIHYNQQY
jgi:hypothetical protein